jgi:ribosomal protein L11 methyltransferase
MDAPSWTEVRVDVPLGWHELVAEDTNYDVMLANIYSDVIQAHALELARRLAPGGWFVFSGCPTHHREATLAAIEGAGLRVREHHQRGRWCTFIGGPKP